MPSALGPRQSAPPGAEKRAPEGSSLALAQFPPSHVGRESPQSLSARHGDDDGCSRPLEHAQSLLVSSGLALQLYARPVDGQSFFAGRSWAREQSLPASLGLALQQFAQPSVVRLSSEESSWVRARSPPSHEEQGRQHIIFVLHDGDDGDWRLHDGDMMVTMVIGDHGDEQAQERLQFVRHSIAGLFFEE